MARQPHHAAHQIWHYLPISNTALGLLHQWHLPDGSLMSMLQAQHCHYYQKIYYSHGDYYVKRLRLTNSKQLTTTFFACWYDPSQMDKIVDAYNSLWLQHTSWCQLGPSNYWEWNKFPWTPNVADQSFIGAIVIQTPSVATPKSSNVRHQPPPNS
jgi:uncharacterized Fe-S cluster protein YjdI